jgi:hypothetical protein
MHSALLYLQRGSVIGEYGMATRRLPRGEGEL